MKFLSLLILTLTATYSIAATTTLSDSPRYYYGEDVSRLTDSDLKKNLHHILDSYHIARENNFDIITDFCHEDEMASCYRHKSHSYKTARKYLFGSLHLEGSSPSNYYVTSIYCLKKIYNDNLPDSTPLGPMKIPSANVINTEHAWPQSLFTSKFSKRHQKSDLHALFPSLMKVNSTRGNNPFGNVAQTTTRLCEEADFGISDSSSDYVFEPANASKGNIARAIFYFSTRYNIKLDELQESTLRQWHNLDPVDLEEQMRNEAIYQIQFNRNPYIDNPEWVDLVEDF